MKTLICIILLLPAICSASYIGAPGVDARTVNCVPQKEAITAWENARSSDGIQARQMVLAVCNPCSCPVNGQSSCYEYLAEEARVKEKRDRDASELLERAKKWGICEAKP